MERRKLSHDEEVVQKHFLALMDDRHKALRRCALHDLFFGPLDSDSYESDDLKEWPGYVKAVEELEDWADTNVSEVWLDDAGNILDKEPEGETIDGTWVEPDGITHFAKKAVYLIVFRELVSDGGMS